MFRKVTQIVARPEVSEILVEELFLQRYDQMLEWALHLMDHRAAQAEDLVHDAFVQLTLSPPDFKTIENLDGYLFVVLRNLHRSQMQRAMRGPVGPEMLVDYDSALAGLKAVDPRQHWQAVEELQLVCGYACARKESSKAGSVLILRFFHGYYPGEVAALLCVSRPAVKELLRMARSEAKLWLEDPAKLGFHREAAKASEIKSGASREETLAHLRQTIFAARQGRCLERQHLAEIYAAAQPELLTVPLLAHLVSCPSCLEEVNRLLKLSPLSDRDPNDMLGPDRGAQASHDHPKVTPFGAHTKTRARQRMLKKYRQRLRDVYEHEPQELRIAVNGFVLARQEITAAVHKQTLGIEVAEELSLIEVLSEQGVRLLALHVAPPPAGAFEQRVSAAFSEGRTLTAQLNFCGSWPHLEIIYDCRLQIADCGFEEDFHSPSLSPVLLEDSQGWLDRMKSTIRSPQSAIQWLLRPVTITILLAALLITAVVGQKLGWWFVPAKPKTAPAKPDMRPGKIHSDAQPADSPGAQPKVSSPSPVPSSVPSPVVAPSATTVLEIEALRLLQQAKADTHEQIEVRRTPAGKLRIEGILETDARKAELLQALVSLRANPAVELQLQTVAEAARRLRASPASPAVAIEREEVTVTKLPVDAELRRHFTSRGVAAEQLDDEIERFAAATLQRSRQMARHAGALRQLAGRFTSAQLQTLDAAARAAWLSLLHSHARSLRDETLQLRAALAPVLSGNGTSINEINSINNDEELRRACERVAQLSAESDRMVRAAFTVSANAAPVGLRSATFFTSLHRIEHLAEAISNTK